MPQIHIDMPTHLNYLAIAVCGGVNFLMGGVWYSALFGKAWLKATRVNPDALNRSGVGARYATAFAGGLVVALCLAYLLKLTHAGTTTEALRTAWTAWFGFTVVATLGDYTFLSRGATLFAINHGLSLVNVTVNALILSGWR